jgi:hypothetical protein
VLVTSLRQLLPTKFRTIVINVNTDLLATRAVLSALDLAGPPVLLVNCDPTVASRRCFERLLTTHDFDVIEMPLRDHGSTLDKLFFGLRDQFLLLLDSDAELLDPVFLGWMRAKCELPNTFGAGFTDGPFYLLEEWAAPREVFWFLERPWIPCVMFNRDVIAESLRNGLSFSAKALPNDVAVSARISRFFGARWGPPWGAKSVRFDALPEWLRREIATWRLDFLWWARREYQGKRPGVAVFDTGASIYQHLRFEKQLLFAGIPVELMDGEVHHYSGVTRHALLGPTLRDTDGQSVEGEVIQRLADRYGYRWDETLIVEEARNEPGALIEEAGRADCLELTDDPDRQVATAGSGEGRPVTGPG